MNTAVCASADQSARHRVFARNHLRRHPNVINFASRREDQAVGEAGDEYESNGARDPSHSIGSGDGVRGRLGPIVLTFGQVISRRRKEIGLSQKELAEKILKEDGTPISPQYLNDLERDRRDAPGDLLIARFAQLLEIDADLLYSTAGELPPDLRGLDADVATKAFAAFRRTVEQER